MKYAALLAGMLVLMAFGVRPALKRAKAPSVATAAAVKELSAKAETQVLNPPSTPEQEAVRTRAQEIFEQVAEHLRA